MSGLTVPPLDTYPLVAYEYTMDPYHEDPYSEESKAETSSKIGNRPSNITCSSYLPDAE